MSTIQIRLPKTVWQELVSLGQEEATSPDHLLEQAVRHFLEGKKRWGLAHKMLHESQQFPLTRPPSHFLCVRVNNLSICLHLKPSFMVKGPPTHRFGARRSQNKGEKPPLALTPATQGYGYTAVAT